MLDAFGIVPQDRKTYNVLLEDVIYNYAGARNSKHRVIYAGLDEQVTPAVRERTNNAILKVFGAPMPKEDEYNRIVSDLLGDESSSDSESEEEMNQKELLERLQKAWDQRDAQRCKDVSLPSPSGQHGQNFDANCDKSTDNQKARLMDSLQMTPIKVGMLPATDVSVDQDFVVMSLQKVEEETETSSAQFHVGSEGSDTADLASNENLSLSRQESRPLMDNPLATSSERIERYARVRTPMRLSSRPSTADLSSLAERARVRHTQQDETPSNCTDSTVFEQDVLNLIQQSRSVESAQEYQHFAESRLRTSIAESSSHRPVHESAPRTDHNEVAVQAVEAGTTNVTPNALLAHRSEWNPFSSIIMHGTPPRAQSHSFVRRVPSSLTRRLNPTPLRPSQFQFHFDDEDEDLFPIEDIVSRAESSQRRTSLVQELQHDTVEDLPPVGSVATADSELGKDTEDEDESMFEAF